MVLYKTTVVNNLVDVDLVLKERNAGVFYRLSSLEKNGGKYEITVNPNTTYREYWIVTESRGKLFTISSDDAVEYGELRVELIDGKYDVTRIRRVTRSQLLPLEAAENGFLRQVSSIRRFLKMSSHALHSVRRRAAKLGLDILDSGKLQTEPGKKYVWIYRDLGDENYNLLLSTPGLALVTINYCQREVENLRDIINWRSLGNLSKGITSDQPSNGIESIKSGKQKGLINHGYLVLEMQSRVPAIPIFYIVAEKHSGERAGIHISAVLPEKIKEVLNDDVIHYSIDCKHKQILLDDLIDILKGGDSHYNLQDANRWDYAIATAKHLLGYCAHMTGTTTEEKYRLDQERAHLRANWEKEEIRRNIKILLESDPQFLRTGVSGQSAGAGARAHCPVPQPCLS